MHETVRGPPSRVQGTRLDRAKISTPNNKQIHCTGVASNRMLRAALARLPAACPRFKHVLTCALGGGMRSLKMKRPWSHDLHNASYSSCCNTHEHHLQMLQVVSARASQATPNLWKKSQSSVSLIMYLRSASYCFRATLFSSTSAASTTSSNACSAPGQSVLSGCVNSTRRFFACRTCAGFARGCTPSTCTHLARRSRRPC